LQVIIVKAEPREFTIKEGKDAGTLMKGASLTLLRSIDGETKRYWKTLEALKKMGFNDSMVSDLWSGKKPIVLEAQFDEKRDGKLTVTDLTLI